MATQAEIDALITLINARADAGSDEAKIAFGDPNNPAVVDPLIHGDTVSGSFDRGAGLGSDVNGSLSMQAFLEGIADGGAAITGTVTMFAGSSAPSNWLLCDGSAVSRTSFASLFSVIGTTYGVGDGSTTFNLPNLVSKFLRGASSPGGIGGSDTNSHTHGITVAADAFAGVAVTTVQGTSTGAPSDSENRPAFLEMLFIIKA